MKSYNFHYKGAPPKEEIFERMGYPADHWGKNDGYLTLVQMGYEMCQEDLKHIGNMSKKTGPSGIQKARLSDLDKEYPKEWLKDYGHNKRRMGFNPTHQLYYDFSRFLILNMMSKENFLEKAIVMMKAQSRKANHKEDKHTEPLINKDTKTIDVKTGVDFGNIDKRGKLC